MNLLVKYTNGRTEIVHVADEELHGGDWRDYVLKNFEGVKDAYCNLRESLRDSDKEIKKGNYRY